MHKLRIIIADDHAVVRQGLKNIIGRTHDLRVVAEAADRWELFKVLATVPSDVLLMDITMPGLNIIDDLKVIRESYPGLPVLILSMHKEEEYGVQAIKAGAAGYMTKESAPEVLVRAIRRVAAGRCYIEERLAEKLVHNLSSKRYTGSVNPLSPREEEVMQKISHGLGTKQIAEALGINEKTVSTYRRRIYEKLCISNEAELIRYAMENGFID